MFGFSWSELLIIAVIALITVGPNDLPRAMKTAARWVRAAQKLAREFQGHVDDLVRQAELEELRDTIKKANASSLNSTVESLVDPNREISSALTPPDIAPASLVEEPESEGKDAEKPATLPSPGGPLVGPPPSKPEMPYDL